MEGWRRCSKEKEIPSKYRKKKRTLKKGKTEILKRQNTVHNSEFGP
jgi:hypothetical protein